MKRLSLDEVLSLHALTIEAHGGISGVRDMSLLDAAIKAPFQTFDHTDLYPEIESKAAHLAFGLIQNHPFLDGNKRTGLLAMLVFLEVNGITLSYSDKELVDLGLKIACGKFSSEKIQDWIHHHVL